MDREAPPVFARYADGSISLSNPPWPAQIAITDALLADADPRLLTQQGDRLTFHTRDGGAVYVHQPECKTHPEIEHYARLYASELPAHP